jgi:hypothetical protein
MLSAFPRHDEDGGGLRRESDTLYMTRTAVVSNERSVLRLSSRCS